MKIDPTLTHDLLERMREAAATAGTGAPGGVQATRSSAAAEATQPALESNLRAIAQRALRGEFESAAAVRAEVVQQILIDRWQGRVEDAQLEQMVEELAPTLVADPEFRRQVDEMLVFAARESGS